MMLIRGIKLSIGAMLGIWIAYFLRLSHPLTAGVIVLLSLGPTKRSSIEIALVRVKALTLALVLASGTFWLLGFTVYAFGWFLFVYIPFVLTFKLEDGLVIGSVLSSHLILAAASDFDILLNTLMLFVIGVVVALVFNLYMPNMSQKIVKDQCEIEDKFREILLIMATMLRGDRNFDETPLLAAEELINNALLRAQANEENDLRTDASYDVSYTRMRKMQLDCLSRMFELGCKIDMDLIQAGLVADLLAEFSRLLSEFNSGERLLQRWMSVLAACQAGLLPKSRREFENRAILFQYLSELRYMVELKLAFSREYGEKK